MNFPISLNITARNILIVGGGPVAYRKAKSVQKHGGNLTIVALNFISEFENLNCTLLKMPFKKDHIDEKFLVFSCTNDSQVNQDVLLECRKQNILCNSVGHSSDFYSPAIAEIDEYQVSVSSSDQNYRGSIQLRDNIKNLMSAKRIPSGIYLTGFGPGDPDLMTFKCHQILQQSHTIFYDDLITSDILDRYQGKAIYVGKRKGLHYKTQEEINQLLANAWSPGKVIARLKGGDPFIFGRGGEELNHLKKNNIPVFCIPGITSSMAAGASIQIPLTMRKTARKLTFMSGHHFDETHPSFPKDGTVVLYMGASKLHSLSKALLAIGWDPTTKVALIHAASHPEEEFEILPLSQIGNSNLKSPLAIILGDVVNEFS